ncbi:MAG TPA: GvpL/GvpF family gas vesicle protein, partial [Terriglobales bacterium]|nr:GvpL/GvpF family gas vesicle protein [Terriglobales bacterium]
MSILPYCIIVSGNADLSAEVGVRNARVEYLEEAGLAVAYSQIDKTDISAGNFQQAALEFHAVVHAIFTQSAAVPFRFPTWLTETELRQHLRSESARYKSFLFQHANHVQMEARIRLAAEPLHPSSSGTEHLRARADQLRKLRDVAEQTKQAVCAEAVQWLERETPEGVR